MPIGPYSQDLLTRIYNVQWGGVGIFVAADSDSNVHRLKLEGTEATWTNLGTLDFMRDEGDLFTGWVLGSSYARVLRKDGTTTPTFVLVGGGGTSNAMGLIMASRNGLEWQRVFAFGTNSGSYTGATIFGVVWNKATQSFFAGGHQEDRYGAESDFRQTETDLLFQSADGFSWSEVERAVLESSTTVPFPPYTTGLLSPKCSATVKDINGSNVPDGVYGVIPSEDGDVRVEPARVPTVDYLFGGVGGYGDSGTVVTGDPNIPPATGIPTTCVATAASRWVAAGGTFGSPGTCLVRGLTSAGWQNLDPGGSGPIVTMCGGVVS
jgi:hypothetical protein